MLISVRGEEANKSAGSFARFAPLLWVCVMCVSVYRCEEKTKQANVCVSAHSGLHLELPHRGVSVVV